MTHRPVATAGGPTAGGEPLGPAVASFLAERDLAPSSRRVYVLALHRLLDRVDADTPLAEVSPRMLAEFMTATYPHLAPASYNRVVATLASLFAYTTRQGWTPTSPATGLERRRPRSDRAAHARARAIPAAELLAFLDADHPLREKTLWWLLYETAARAGPRPQRRRSGPGCPARRGSRQGRPGRGHRLGDQDRPAAAPTPAPPARRPAVPHRHRPRTRPPTSPGRLRPRHRPGPAVLPASRRDIHHGRRRLDPAPRLTHLAKAGVGLPMLMTKSRHTSLLASLAIYAKPTFDTVAAATAALDPDRRR